MPPSNHKLAQLKTRRSSLHNDFVRDSRLTREGELDLNDFHSQIQRIEMSCRVSATERNEVASNFMRFHRILPNCIQSEFQLSEQCLRASRNHKNGIWLTYSDFKKYFRGLSRWTGEIVVEHPWVDRHTISPHLPPFTSVALVSNGTESDLFKFGEWVASRTYYSSSLVVRSEVAEYPHQFIQRLPSISPIYFEFSPWSPQQPQRWTAQDLFDLQSAAKTWTPSLKIRPFPGLEVWDDRIDPELELAPCRTPQFRNADLTQEPELSVIIPTHNNRYFLESVLINLHAQTVPVEKFEIIVIDDGSTDGTNQMVEQLIAEKKITNLCYVSLPRTKNRRPGDHHYRAGIARNLGAQVARAEWLLFLDSDMIVRPEFLNRLIRAQGKSDVIQCVRHHIHPRFCGPRVLYQNVCESYHTYIEEEAYWGPFFETKEWMNLKNFWKFTCTYCLMLKKSDFHLAGGFKSTFTTYGFEDVDLGYELFRLGKRFDLLDEVTLHLTPTAERSEYGHSNWKRRKLLSRTAKTFYRQHLDPEIFSTLGYLMKENLPFDRMQTKFLRALNQILSD